MNKKYFGKIISILVMVLSVFTYFFRGHTYIGVNGFLVVLSTPAKATNTSNQDSFYCYEVIVNGAAMKVVLGELYEPLQLTSKKLGELELNILADIRDEKQTIQESENFFKVQRSDYSIRQVNLLYEYFDEYFNENRILTVPDYTDRSGGELRLLVELALLFGVFVFCKEKCEKRVVSVKQNVLILVCVAFALYLSIEPIVTIL